MPENEGSDPEREERLREAALIFERLDEDPDNAEAQRARDKFVARGDAEREAYDQVARAVRTAKFALKSKPKSPPYVFAFLFTLIGALLYATHEPALIYLRADETTGFETRKIELASGDKVTLDASTAIIDNSDDQIRRVTLLKGAAYFDIERAEQRFVVDVDDILVEVIGTEFEVAKLRDQLLVSVASGEVSVRLKGQTKNLKTGDQLRVSDGETPTIDQNSLNNIGAWRDDLILAEGMTFGEVIDVIDRRLPGPVFVLSNELKNREFAGRINLANPLDALRAVAATTGAEVTSVSPIMTIISMP